MRMIITENNMKLYVNDQSDKEYNLSLETWRHNHKDVMQQIKKEEKKATNLKRHPHKKKSLLSAIFNIFRIGL